MFFPSSVIWEIGPEDESNEIMSYRVVRMNDSEADTRLVQRVFGPGLLGRGPCKLHARVFSSPFFLPLLYRYLPRPPCTQGSHHVNTPNF
jgi:hypothetical protein